MAAAGALVALAVVPVPGGARGPGGGYNDPYDRSRDADRSDGWSAAHAPLQWLRSSGKSFQSLMHMLAQRAADVSGADRRPLPAAPLPARGWEDAPQPEPDGAWQSDRGRTAHARKWRRRAAWCRYAGFEVPRNGWYVVQRGDTLWNIAEAHYGYGRAYRRIWRANPDRIADPHLIYPCQHLYIARRWHRPPPGDDQIGPPPERWPGADSRRRGPAGSAHGGSNTVHTRTQGDGFWGD